jgi:hypothetical protein
MQRARSAPERPRKNDARARARSDYRRFFVGQALASARFTKLRPDMQPREDASLVGGRWWKQRAPLSARPRGPDPDPDGASEAALAAALDARTFSYEDWWRARTRFEIAPLARFARTVGRGYAFRQSDDPTTKKIIRAACGFPAAPGEAPRARRKLQPVKQLWLCIYTVLGAFANQRRTSERAQPLRWRGGGRAPQAAPADGPALRCAVTGRRTGVRVYRCTLQYPSHSLAHWLHDPDRVAERGFLRWVDHPDACRAAFSVPLCAQALELVANVLDALFHSTVLCHAASNSSGIANRLLGGRNIVATERPLSYIAAVADVGCDMALQRTEAIERGCAWLDARTDRRTADRPRPRPTADERL